MYTADLREEISQGDVLEDFPVVDAKFAAPDADPETSIRRSRVLLLSNDCDYDNCRYVLVAEVRSLTDVASEHRGNVRDGRSRRTFYLSESDHFPESFADLRCIHRVEKRFIAECARSSARGASLVDDERLALRRSIAVFFGIDPTEPEA